MKRWFSKVLNDATILILIGIIIGIILDQHVTRIRTQITFYTDVVATVDNTIYKDPYMGTTLMYNAVSRKRIQLPDYHPAEYLVTVRYMEYEATFDNQELFETVKVGDFIHMRLSTTYNYKGERIKAELVLPT